MSRIAILGAMQPEIQVLFDAIELEQATTVAGIDVRAGRLFGRDCVIARTGMGKVSAAAAVQHLIDRWNVGTAVVCGLAGSLRDDLALGDVVVGSAYVQHDVDASPIFPRWVVPGLGVSSFEAPPSLVRAAREAAAAFLANRLYESIRPEVLQLFSIRQPKVVAGTVATGDQFIKDGMRDALSRDLPDALCVEMEGGALAQVCHVNSVPFVAVRTISDNAGPGAAVDFKAFLEEVAPHYTLGIARELLARLP